MVVLRSSVRAMSVPVGGEPRFSGGESPRFLDSSTVTHNSRLISNAALNDADALTLASKRHDNQLMRDINARLAQAAFAQPVTVKRTKPPLPPTRLPTTVRVPRSDLAGIRSSVINNDESDLGMVPTPVTSRVMRSIRATSVPPQLPSSAVPHTLLYSTVSGYEDPRRSYYQTPVTIGSATKFRYGGGQDNGRPVDKRLIYNYAQKYPDNNFHKRPPGTHLSPSSELAVRQAHRNLDRIERELSFSSNSGAASPPPSPRIYTTYVPDVGPRRRSSSYHGPITSVPRGVSPLRAGARSPSPSPILTGSYYHHVPSHVIHHVPSHVIHHVPSHVIHHVPSHVVVTDVKRSRPTVVDLNVTHPVKRMDPSLELLLLQAKAEPVPRGVDGYSTYVWNTAPSSDIAGARPSDLREEINSKLRELSRERPMVSTPVASAPKRSELPTVTRPRVSETRRKVREVLCKVKNDPHYYD